jgi:hypothetical protein
MQRMSAKILSPVLLALAVTGCATLFASHSKDLSLTSSPVGAEVFVDGNPVGVAPVKFNVNNHKSHVITFKLAGHQPATCTLDTRTGAGWVILDVLGGLIPVIIDAATGNWTQLTNDSCYGTLTPIPATAPATGSN